MCRVRLQIGVQESARTPSPNASIAFKPHAKEEVGRRHKSEGQEPDAQRVT